MIDIAQMLTGIGGIIGGGGYVAFRRTKIDAGQLALDIARDAEKKAQRAIDRVDDFQRLAMAHFPWDLDAMKEINRLGGRIGEPPSLFPTE